MKKTLILVALVSLTATAQTKLFLNQTTPSLSPAVNAAWQVTTGNAVWQMATYTDRATGVSITSGQVGAAAVRKVLIRQFVSQPLAPQTINGTLTGQVRYNMNSVTSRTGQGFVYFRIINTDGTIASEVGTLTTTDLTTVLTNRTLIALTLSGVTVTAGQRFCIDLGWNYATGSATTTTGTAAISGVAFEMPVDNTTTTAGKAWIQFSQTIKFQADLSNGFF